jgi:hypothetical protein
MQKLQAMLSPLRRLWTLDISGPEPCTTDKGKGKQGKVQKAKGKRKSRRQGMEMNE